MQLWELTIPILLKKELSMKNMYFELSKVINKTMLLDDKLKEFHKLNTFKMYVFSGLFPVSKQGYKKGNMYFFKFRTVDRTFALKMKNLLKTVPNELFDVVTLSLESKKQEPLKGLYTLTPSIAVFTPENSKSRHWTKEDFTLEEIITRMNVNAIKKYKAWTGEEVDEDHKFIESVEQLNEKVIVLDYKSTGKLLTNKFRIQVKEDKLSQALAFMVMGTGLLEKNSLGLGFCTYAK